MQLEVRVIRSEDGRRGREPRTAGGPQIPGRAWKEILL